MAKQLTASQKKFAEEFVMNDGSKTKEECALSAGYSKSSARVRASELTNPQKYLKKVPCDQCNGTGENLKEDVKETCDGIANVI